MEYNKKEEISANDGWTTWSKHVLFELERLNNSQENSNKELHNRIDDLKNCVNRKHMEQIKMCSESRDCNAKSYVSQKLFYWLISAMFGVMLTGGGYLFSLHIEQAKIKKQIELIHPTIHNNYINEQHEEP